jgi:hypothetical protein
MEWELALASQLPTGKIVGEITEYASLGRFRVTKSTTGLSGRFRFAKSTTGLG